MTIAANGTWTYTLDNADHDTEALTQGQPVTDVFTYTMRDAKGATASATLIIDITGSNDAPTLADVNAGALTDTSINDGFADLTGALAGNDRDGGETASLTYAALNATDEPVTTVAGQLGSLTVNTNGGYDYVPDPWRSTRCRLATIPTPSRCRPPTCTAPPAPQRSRCT